MSNTTITNQDLINIIVNDKRYKSICKSIVKRQTHLADDLYQEAMLAIIENKDDRLMNAYNQSRLEVFIVGILNNIWNMRGRSKSYINGQTSNLMEYSSGFNINSLQEKLNVNSEHFEVSPFDYNPIVRRVINRESLDYDPKADHVFMAAKEIIKKDCESNDKVVRYKARVYNYSNNNIAGLEVGKSYKNARQFSKTIEIPYSAIHRTCSEYKSYLNKQLKHLLND